MQKRKKMGSQGENLIFLISPPRAGSTLLQKILGSHPDIHTISEPWIMLHPFYALRSDGYEAEYGHAQALSALDNFLHTLAGGEDDYFEGMRRMYGYLYDSVLKGLTKRYFLDKTPRYYLIIPELYRVFPKARFIILFRNPIAVMCSILETWVKKDWYALSQYKNDLINAPRLLLDGAALLKNRCIRVHYEQFVSNPSAELQRICKELEIEFKEEMIEYGNNNRFRWEFGDQESVNKRTRPDPKNVGKWTSLLSEPQIWRLAKDYLEILGEDILEQLGYSYKDLTEIVQTLQPRRIRLKPVAPLYLLLKERKNNTNKLKQIILTIWISIRWKGLRTTAVAMAKGGFRGVS